MTRRTKLAALSAVIWSAAVVIVVAFVLGAVFSELDRQIDALVKAIGGRV